MSDSTAAPAAPTSFWEDVIDIFFQPAAVFRRRETKSVWPPMLFVAISIAIIFAATFNTIEPAFDADFTRGMTQAMAKNSQMTAEMADKMRGFAVISTRYGVGIVMLFTMFLLGCITWAVGKLVDSKQTFHAALVVAAWGSFPRVLGAVLGAVQGLLLDPAKLTSMLSLSLSPARFLDPDKSNPLIYQIAGRFDLITIWVTILLGVGVYATGKVSRERAIIVAILIWVIGSLPAIRQGYMAM